MDDSFHDSAYPFALPGNDAHRDRILPRADHRAPAAADASDPDTDYGYSEPISSGAIHRQFGRPPGRRSCVGKLLTTTPPPAIAAQITARASGHCEVMAPACTYQQARHLLPPPPRRNAPTICAAPPTASPPAATALTSSSTPTSPPSWIWATSSTPARPTSVTAMLWRQHRWVYLDIRGRIHDAVESTLSNTAC